MYINDHPEIVKRLVCLMDSPHILQLILNMLTIERQIKEYNIPATMWSKNCNFFSEVVDNFMNRPIDYISSFVQLLIDISNRKDTEIISFLCQEKLLSCVLSSLLNKDIVLEIIILLDQVLLKLIKEDRITLHHNKLEEILNSLLKSDSLISALAAVKLIQSLIKHKLTHNLNAVVIDCISLFNKYKWSNILHSSITDILCSIISLNDIKLIDQILREGKLPVLIIDTLSNKDLQVGFKGHMSVVANVLVTCNIAEVSEVLKMYPLWDGVLKELQYLNQMNLAYVVDKPDRSQRKVLCKKLKDDAANDNPNSKFVN